MIKEAQLQTRLTVEQKEKIRRVAIKRGCTITELIVKFIESLEEV